jgi:hypothetical protein
VSFCSFVLLFIRCNVTASQKKIKYKNITYHISFTISRFPSIIGQHSVMSVLTSWKIAIYTSSFLFPFLLCPQNSSLLISTTIILSNCVCFVWLKQLWLLTGPVWLWCKKIYDKAQVIDQFLNPLRSRTWPHERHLYGKFSILSVTLFFFNFSSFILHINNFETTNVFFY